MDSEFIVTICRRIINVIFAVCLACILSYTFFAQVLQQGFSMAPYINDRKVVLVNRLYKNLLPLKRNDVIVFYNGEQESVKRIYGLPGETIAIIDSEFYVDNKLFDVDILKNSLSSNIEQNVKLGDDEYYVLGDNLDSSKDSRFSDVGNIKREDIVGKVWFVFK